MSRIYCHRLLNFLQFTCFLILVSFTISSAQNSRSNPDTLSSSEDSKYFDHAWQFNNSDSHYFSTKNLDDTYWPTVDDIRALEDSSKSLDLFGISWFRYYVVVDSVLLNKPFVLLIKQSGASQIFLDGILIDSAGKVGTNNLKDYKTEQDNPLIFTFKENGVHVFAIRYDIRLLNKDKDDKGFSIRLIEANLYNKYVSQSIEETTVILMLIVGVFVALGFIHFLLFIFYRRAFYNFYFGLYNFSIAAISYIGYILGTENSVERLNSAKDYLFFAFLIFGLSITGFINFLFGRKKIRFKVLLIIAGLLAIIFSIDNTVASISLFFYILIVVIEGFIVILRAMIRKERAAFIVGIGILMFFIVIALVISVTIANGGSFDTGSGWIGENFNVIFFILLISFPISISAYLAWQFAATNFKLQTQLSEVEKLSAYTLQQEQEKQQILENQNENLEIQVAERTQELQIEKKKSDDLLLNILPQEVAEELKEKGESKAQQYDEVSVLFTDFVNFTSISEKMGVDELLAELNASFTAFDQIMEKHNIEKIKTIGDAYLAVSGLPIKNQQHAQNAVAAALEIIAFVENRKKEVSYGLDIRIGIHSGALIAGIVGVKKFAYDIWGDTVNTAARMEQTSAPGRVNISASTFDLVKNEFDCEHRGKLNAKGKGEMDMYFVNKKIKNKI